MRRRVRQGEWRIDFKVWEGRKEHKERSTSPCISAGPGKTFWRMGWQLSWQREKQIQRQNQFGRLGVVQKNKNEMHMSLGFNKEKWESSSVLMLNRHVRHNLCPKLSCYYQPKSAVPDRSLLRECQLQLPRTHTLQSSNPSANALLLPSKCSQNLTTFVTPVALVPATSISHLDYCYCSLTGLPVSTLVPLQSILNIPARGIHLKHITPLLKILQWSPISLRANVKGLKMTFRALFDLIPSALIPFHSSPSSFCSSHTDLSAVPQTYQAQSYLRAFVLAASLAGVLFS